jgi:hypothetical protein
MTTKQIIENLTDWVSENICSKIELKVPDDYQNGDEYNVTKTNPAAFPLYVPAKDRIAPEVVAPIPSVCLQLMEGSDNIKNRARTMKLRLCLAAWNPGEHPGERFAPVPDPDVLGGYHYTADVNPGQKYKRNADGWKDLYNFQDVALRALEAEQIIAGVRVDSDTPITYGPFTEDGAIWDYYPYWNGWIAFTIVCGVPRQKPESYDDLL